MDEPIYYSYSGKADDRLLHGIHVTENKIELRRRAFMLWYDMRQRQLEGGVKVTAAVWIGNSRMQPSKQEIEEYEQLVHRVVSASSVSVDDTADELQEAMPVHNESGTPAEQAPHVVADDEGASEPEAPPIVLDDADDLDF